MTLVQKLMGAGISGAVALLVASAGHRAAIYCVTTAHHWADQLTALCNSF